jgi:polysaccharide export outer membrane protein
MRMKLYSLVRFQVLVLAGLLLLSVSGCVTTDPTEVMHGEGQVLPRLQVGDVVTITLVGPPETLMPLEKPITDDGSISLPDVGSVQAAGKTPGELEASIYALYVPKIYTHLSVTVKTTSDRVYFVRGEVHSPGRLVYVGPITVTKAITSAGDFTDFANHHRIYLIRANGKRFELDGDQILAGEFPDPPVFPGDQIEVKRRIM